MCNSRGQRRRPMSNGSINKTLVTLTQILDSAVEHGPLTSNPAAGKRRRLKESKPIRRLLEADDLRELLYAAAELDRSSRRYRIGRQPRIAVMAKAGLRVTEMCQLRWRDVDVHHKRLVIGEAKHASGCSRLTLQLSFVGAWLYRRNMTIFPSHTVAARPQPPTSFPRDSALPIDAVEFEIAVSAAILDDLQRRLRATRWPAEPASEQPWQWGPPVAYARRVVEYWTTAYDWRSSEREINSFCNYVATLESLDVHFILERGSGSDPRPLIITHGWPGSIVGFLGVIERLAHPERFGGDVADAFTVVCPSIPGYGFSGAPSRPITPRDVARMWNMLMTEKLGFDTYFAQGGDWGGIVTSRMAYDYPDRLEAIHLNLFAFDQGGSSVGLAGPITGELSDVERDWRRRMAARRDPESGYRTQQGTKPQALAFGLTDSPVGLGMWILEKFHAWTIPGRRPRSAVQPRSSPGQRDAVLARGTGSRQLVVHLAP